MRGFGNCWKYRWNRSSKTSDSPRALRLQRSKSSTRSAIFIVPRPRSIQAPSERHKNETHSSEQILPPQTTVNVVALQSRRRSRERLDYGDFSAAFQSSVIRASHESILTRQGIPSSISTRLWHPFPLLSIPTSSTTSIYQTKLS